jgi:hypothetical protein
MLKIAVRFVDLYSQYTVPSITEYNLDDEESPDCDIITFDNDGRYIVVGQRYEEGRMFRTLKNFNTLEEAEQYCEGKDHQDDYADIYEIKVQTNEIHR